MTSEIRRKRGAVVCLAIDRLLLWVEQEVGETSASVNGCVFRYLGCGTGLGTSHHPFLGIQEMSVLVPTVHRLQPPPIESTFFESML